MLAQTSRPEASGRETRGSHHAELTEMTRNAQKTLLAAGYLCLLGASAVVHRAPATQYELSLYAGTPALAWAFLAGAYLVAVGVAVGGRGRHRGLALVLGSAATVLLVGLPLARGYRFLGAGDSLTHLGWARSISAGTLSPVALLYPAVHVTGVLLRRVTGESLEWSLMLVTVLFALVYLAFVPAVVRRVVRTRWALVAATVSAWLILPINDVSVYLMPFPTMQAISFFPLVLFVTLLYLEGGAGASGPRLEPASTSLLLGLLGAVLLFVHPQQMVNYVLLLYAIAGTQLLFRRYEPNHVVANHRLVLGPALFFSGLLALWMTTHPRTQSALSGAVNAILRFGSSGSSAVVAQRGQSLAALGSGLLAVFLKLFGVSVVYLLLSLSAVAGVWLYRSLDQRVESLVAYCSAAAVPLAALFAVYYVSTPTMAFRQLGFGMALATILGAMELARLWEDAESRFPRRRVRTVAAVAFALFVVSSAAMVFPSPYVLKPSGHVTDQELDGYGSVFAYREGSLSVVGVRGGPERFDHAVEGLDDPVVLRVEGVGGEVPARSFAAGNLTSVYGEDTYLVVTRADREREVRLYDGFRYPARGFERLPRQRGVDRVLDNGELRLYRVNGTA